MVDVAIVAAKALVVVLIVLLTMGHGVFFERKVSAIIQDRIGANRASIFGVAALGIINTLVADPLKFLLKEDIVPANVDRLLHFLAPVLSVLPLLVTFAVVPFGDVLVVGGRSIDLQAAELDVGVLYVLAMVAMAVYGVVLAGWASNNRWSLLGAVRGSAQMISYEIAMGLALIAVVLTYETLDLQTIVRAQGALLWGWLPAWGVLYQPLAFVVFMTAGIAESKRIPFDLPESESELVSGYFTEYSGAKHLMFMMSDFVEVVLVAALVTTLFFGGWQVPYLLRDGFHFPGGSTVPLPSLAVTGLQVLAFVLKLHCFTLLQIVIRWTLPRFRYDQLMRLGWQGLLPLSLANVVASAFVIVFLQRPAA
ncbi:MAG TPA: NADH-quinone oxidoreductase subunit NuoH [Candidatus Binatia bacterium]|nr:NADH-quinone oxidoreductase subunit NuoH [Candidatus Binatia bacterium]